MNRERLTILRDHLASLPDERFDMAQWARTDGVNLGDPASIEVAAQHCGTVACIAGWACFLFPGGAEHEWVDDYAGGALGLNADQRELLFAPERIANWGGLTRADAIAAIQSMLDNPADDALPVWPEKVGAVS